MTKTKQTIELPTFETIEQLMADKYLLERVAEKINYFNTERNRVSEGGKLKLKKSPIDLLIALNKFTAEFMATELIEIQYKRSKLPSSVRIFIQLTISECVVETFKHYEHIFQKQNKKSLKAKNDEN